MRQIFFVFLVVTLLAPLCRAEEQLPLKEQKVKDSYSLGYEFGDNLKRQGAEIDLEVLISAIKDGLDGKKPVLSPEEIRDTLIQVRKKLMVLQDRRYRELSAKNIEEGKAFLEANKTKEGVHILPSGLQYKVLRDGEGPTPKATDIVTFHYRGTMIDGNEFDSSYARGKPSTVHVFGVIEGWTEALQLMKVGSKWQIFVPPALAYGDRQFGHIPPNSTLIFEIELLSIGESQTPGASELEDEGSNGSLMKRDDATSKEP
jgi:FKBP-type peptidyl-prolyl cis-trans isomerase FklB